MKAIVLLSGGMDSATALFLATATYGPKNVEAIAVDYGQRHVKELSSAGLVAESAGVELVVVKSAALGFGRNALTDHGIEVPEGHYAHESMAQTVVPNRNMVLLAYATAWAHSVDGAEVWYGAHAGDHPIYQDCRPEFVEAMREAISKSTGSVRLVAPFVFLSKTDIARLGTRLGVPFELTWSCYKGGERHCGKCGTCVERKEAFSEAEVNDPTEYQC